jgi:glyoxylase-like metal-dependent hydrolase (beta-lactamase superfamily II)
MFAGADPPAELHVPRFAPQPCTVDQIVTEGEIGIAGLTVEVVPLPGHTATHTGYIVDDVFFVGDALAGQAELAGLAVSYTYSVTLYLETLEKLRNYACAYYVLGHGRLERDISGLIEQNIARISETIGFIKGCLAEKDAETSAILKAVCQHYGVELHSIRAYFVWYPVIHSFLSHLCNGGEVVWEISDNELLWHAVERG